MNLSTTKGQTMNLTDTQFDAIESAAFDAEAELRSYSGRAMFGQQCLALQIDSIRNLTAFFISLAVDDQDLAAKLSRDLRTDSLGLGEIAYWPSIGVPDSMVEDDEDEDC